MFKTLNLLKQTSRFLPKTANSCPRHWKFRVDSTLITWDYDISSWTSNKPYQTSRFSRGLEPTTSGSKHLKYHIRPQAVRTRPQHLGPNSNMPYQISRFSREYTSRSRALPWGGRGCAATRRLSFQADGVHTLFASFFKPRHVWTVD